MALAVIEDFAEINTLNPIKWSRHNQLVITSPKVLHLLVPHTSIDKKLSFSRGFISYETIFSIEEVKRFAFEKRLHKSLSWNIRHRFIEGFRCARWWPKKDCYLDRLVVVCRSGRVVILECQNSDISNGKSWKPINMPELRELSNNLDICCCEIGQNGELILCMEDGSISMFKDGETRRDYFVPDPENYDIICSCALNGNTLVIITANGTVLECNTLLTSWKVIVNDGILQPGQVVFPLNQKPAINYFFTKLSTLYHISDGRLIQKYQISGSSHMISGILPNSKNDDTLILTNLDNSFYELDLQSGKYQIIPNPFYTHSNQLANSERLDDEEGDTTSDDLDQTDEMATQEAEAHTSSNNYISNYGLTLDPCFKVAWSVEVETLSFHKPIDSKLYLFKVSSNKMNDNNSSFPASDRDIFIDSLLTDRPNQRLEMRESELSQSHCPLCSNPLARSPKDRSVLFCDSGHIFDICHLSGVPIAGGLIDTLSCYRCGAKVSTQHKSIYSSCPFCNGGVFLKVSTFI